MHTSERTTWPLVIMLPHYAAPCRGDPPAARGSVQQYRPHADLQIANHQAGEAARWDGTLGNCMPVLMTREVCAGQLRKGWGTQAGRASASARAQQGGGAGLHCSLPFELPTDCTILPNGAGTVALITAGTADPRVVEECRLMLQASPQRCVRCACTAAQAAAQPPCKAALATQPCGSVLHAGTALEQWDCTAPHAAGHGLLLL